MRMLSWSIRKACFLCFFSQIYPFGDQDRSIHARSIGLGAIYGGLLAFLIGALLTLKLPVKEQTFRWNAILPLCYGILERSLRMHLPERGPDKQMKLF